MSKRLVILGAGESGIGAAILGKQNEYDVFVSDMGVIAKKYNYELKVYNNEYVLFYKKNIYQKLNFFYLV